MKTQIRSFTDIQFATRTKLHAARYDWSHTSAT